jgi:hypothetical protein
MKHDAVAELEELLARKRARTGAGKATTPPRLIELRTWQAARLARTYRDLREDPQCAPAIEFFLTDLYGAHDFAARDRDVVRAWRYMKHSLPGVALEALANAIELDLLTAELDEAMAAMLPSGALTEASYARAYRLVGRRDARERQISLIVGIGQDLERAVRHAWIGALLRAAHGPAHAAGFGVLQDFLERGYSAFRKMRSAHKVLDTVQQRETRLMEAMFAGAVDPFADLDAGARK